MVLLSYKVGALAAQRGIERDPGGLITWFPTDFCTRRYGGGEGPRPKNLIFLEDTHELGSLAQTILCMVTLRR